jgi:hypothetical protein
MTGDRFTWRPEDVQVTPPRTCEACRGPLPDPPDPDCPSLCATCCERIDRDTDELLEIAWWEAGP